jgi:hypothetical protein
VPLERTGPFIPAVTVPSRALVVTEAMRVTIEKARLSGAIFVPVHKARIVRYAWETWDLSAPRPAEVPPSHKPEDYLKTRPHDPSAASEMGPVFQLVPGGKIRVSIVETPIGIGTKMVRDPATGAVKDVPNVERTKHVDVADNSDFSSTSPNGRPVFVSERAREILGADFLRYDAWEG